MPVQNFVKLFQSWGPNDNLSIKCLRLKAITLMAIICMTRPSDLAPRGVIFDNDDFSFAKYSMSLNNIVFQDDGSLTITFFGIKNYRTRSGFEVNIPKIVKDEFNDPVSALKSYIEKTSEFRPMDTKPLFISLNQPFKAISSDTVRNILEEAIKLAGIDNMGISAKSFRPTGATLAVDTGVLPETTMQIGRWKTKETFMNHYVYPRAPTFFTEQVFDDKKH